jgi:hypothetical protein
MIKETLHKFGCRHAVAKRHPVNNCFDWIPPGESRDHAGMTNKKYSGLVQSFPGSMPHTLKTVLSFFFTDLFFSVTYFGRPFA